MHEVVEGRVSSAPARPRSVNSHGSVTLPAIRAALSASGAVLRRLSSKRTRTVIGKPVGGSTVGEGGGDGAAVVVAQGVGVMATVERGELVGVELPHPPTRTASAATAADASTRRSAQSEPGRAGLLGPFIRSNGTPSPSMSCGCAPMSYRHQASPIEPDSRGRREAFVQDGGGSRVGLPDTSGLVVP